jgi:hypothetical protein
MVGKTYLVEKLKQNGDSFSPVKLLRTGRKGFYPSTHSVKNARKLTTMKKARDLSRHLVNPIRIHPATIKFVI